MGTTHGVAMGSPLDHGLANAFVRYHEQVWLNPFALNTLISQLVPPTIKNNRTFHSFNLS